MWNPFVILRNTFSGSPFFNFSRFQSRPETKQDSLSRAIPNAFFLAAFLDTQSVNALCRVNRCWKAKNTPKSVDSLLVSVFFRNLDVFFGYAKVMELLKKQAELKVKFFPCSSISTYANYWAELEHNRPPMLKLPRIFELMPQLKKLEIPLLNEDDNRAIMRFTTLDYLQLTQYSDRSLFCLYTLTRLKTLVLSPDKSSLNISNSGLLNLSVLTRLESLQLHPRSSLNISDSGVQNLSLLTSLKYLTLTGCEGIVGTGLRNLNALIYLSLDCPQITDNGLQGLTSFSALLEFHIWKAEQITNSTLQILRNITSLRVIKIMRSPLIDDEGLQHISEHLFLENLCLQDCGRFTDVGLQSLATLTSLQGLVINNMSITHDTLLSLQTTLIKLHHLHLSSEHMLVSWK